MTTIHKNDMTAWPAIACQRGHTTHARTLRPVSVGRLRHAYGDYPPIPARLSRVFQMELWDTVGHPVDGGPYCPAHDAVSATIVSHGIWEPRETILTLDACTRSPGGLFIDFGAQIGWFSLLAASCGLDVLAFEADAANAELLRDNAALNGWGQFVTVKHERIDATSPPLDLPVPIALAKIDIEGAEADALRMLAPALDDGYVERILMESSPVFHDGYPDLVRSIIDRGFRCYGLPPKRRPPHVLDVPDLDLLPWRIDDMQDADIEARIQGAGQEDLWFVRSDLRA